MQAYKGVFITSNKQCKSPRHTKKFKNVTHTKKKALSIVKTKLTQTFDFERLKETAIHTFRVYTFVKNQMHKCVHLCKILELIKK